MPRVPLVVFRNGKRIPLGEAEVLKDGAIRGYIQNPIAAAFLGIDLHEIDIEEVAEEIAPYMPKYNPE